MLLIPPAWRVVDAERNRYERFRNGEWEPFYHCTGGSWSPHVSNRCFAATTFAQAQADWERKQEGRPPSNRTEAERLLTDAALDAWLLSISPMKPCAANDAVCVDARDVRVRCA